MSELSDRVFTAAQSAALCEVLRDVLDWSGREPVPFDVPKVCALIKRAREVLAKGVYDYL